MNQFLSEIHEKYTKIVKRANLIGFLNWLAVSFNLTDKSTLDSNVFTGVCLGTGRGSWLSSKHHRSHNQGGLHPGGLPEGWWGYASRGWGSASRVLGRSPMSVYKREIRIYWNTFLLKIGKDCTHLFCKPEKTSWNLLLENLHSKWHCSLSLTFPPCPIFLFALNFQIYLPDIRDVKTCFKGNCFLVKLFRFRIYEKKLFRPKKCSPRTANFITVASADIFLLRPFQNNIIS